MIGGLVMQVKAKEVLDWHPIAGCSYITQGTLYQVIETLPAGVFVIRNDDGQRTCIALDNCAHGVIWEVVDAS